MALPVKIASCFGALEYWSTGVLEYWSIGVLVNAKALIST
jgi:hypothetical protein